jgi:hypothetical protein
LDHVVGLQPNAAVADVGYFDREVLGDRALQRDVPLAPFYIAGIAVIFWVAFFFVNRRIDD